MFFPLPASFISDEATAVFNILLEASESQKVGAILRVAGGWVRDTLNGVPTHDIEIVIETIYKSETSLLITGEVFALGVANHLSAHSLGIDHNSTVSVIKTNPEKSKHIATAHLAINGISIYFRHLRAADNTGTNGVVKGTPEEDARHRDFTVNALFYNLGTKMIEDYTTGVNDIEGRLIRAPLDDLQTFKNDPLRLLRGIRYAGQLGYLLFPEGFSASEYALLIPMLNDLVLRERIGMEFTKMMCGNDPAQCARLLITTGMLRSTILQEVHYAKSQVEGKWKTKRELRPAIPDFLDVEIAKELDFESWLGDRLNFTSSSNVTDPEDRSTVFCLMMLVPLALKGLLGDVAQEGPTYGSRSSISKKKISAILSNGLHLSGVLVGNVYRLLSAVQVLDNYKKVTPTFISTLLHLAESKDSCFALNHHREVMFDMLAALNYDKMISTGPRLALTVFLLSQNMAFSDVAVLVSRLEADTHLVNSTTIPCPMSGREVAEFCAKYKVEKRKTAYYVTAQRKFLLHKPLATKREVMWHLIDIHYSQFTSTKVVNVVVAVFVSLSLAWQVKLRWFPGT